MNSLKQHLSIRLPSLRNKIRLFLSCLVINSPNGVMLVRYSPESAAVPHKKNKKQTPEQWGFLLRHFLFAISLPSAVLRRLNKTLYIYRPHSLVFHFSKPLTSTLMAKHTLKKKKMPFLRSCFAFDWLQSLTGVSCTARRQGTLSDRYFLSRLLIHFLRQASLL